MAQTVISGKQVKDATIQRVDLDTSTVGQAVVTKIVQGSGINLSSTGADSGTGDVTVSGVSPPLADATQSGLLRQTSGNTTDFIDGTNNSQALQPVIWSVRLRSFNALGNPTFEVNQRSPGASNAGAAITLSGFPLDRWNVQKVGTLGFSAQQMSAGTGVGGGVLLPGTNYVLTKSFLRITLTAQEASLAAGDFLSIYGVMDGPIWRGLSGDVHSGEILIRSSIGGFRCGVAVSDGSARSLTKLAPATLVANTWTLVPFPNLPVWPSGGGFTSVQGSLSYYFFITLACGSTYTAPANDTWQNGYFFGASGQNNFGAQAVNSTFDIAFAQHEPGALCSTPIDCPFPINLDACLPYFDKSYDYATALGTVTANGICPMMNAAASAAGPVRFKKSMAKVPSVTIYNHATGAANSVYDGGGAVSRAVTGVQYTGEKGFASILVTGMTAALGAYCYPHYIADTGW